MIVDDEVTIRRGLIGYIDWESLSCSVEADFENGQLAIEYLQNHPVDLIISDIKMPGADGIELSRYVHEHHPETRVILYTGYSDFDYAQSAIEYGVADFIVKPSNMDKIIQTIQKNIEKIEIRRQKEHHISTLETQLEDVKENEKLNFIKNFIEGEDMDPVTLEKALVRYNIHINSYCLLLYRIKRQKTIDHNQTIQFINLSMSELNQYTFKLNNTTYGTLVAFEKRPKLDPIHQLRDKCSEINDFVTNYINGSIFIGVSDVHHSLSDAPIAFMEAQRCLDNSFYGNNPLTFYSKLKDINNNPTHIELNLDRISQHISKGDEEKAIQVITYMFRAMADSREPVDYIKSMGIAMYTVSMGVVKKHNLSSEDIFTDSEPYHDILKAEQIDDLIDVLSSMIHTIINYLSEGNNNYIIKQTLKYMNENYQSPIKLKDIADHIHINSSYLSRLFKDKTSQTVTQTLRNIRIEKAKELLLDGSNKTYEIASEVGFDDAAYFSYVFKQETGYSPSDYRNLNKG